MNENKKFNIIIGVALTFVGVILILCGAFPNIIDILLGVAACIAAVAILIKSLISKKQILQIPVLISAVLLAIGITLFVKNGVFGEILLEVLNYSLITLGAVFLADTIYHFVKGRNLAANIVETVLAAALITIGIVALIPSVEVGGLVFFFSGAVIIFAGIIVTIASLINFNKYKKIEAQPVQPQKNTNTSSKKKHKKK